ncbi:MAG TPA: hypothetical protein VGP33_15190, partial [Chloroflexota bacterium]|nr:hypothetical protein [Chloroflexota bacterium]
MALPESQTSEQRTGLPPGFAERVLAGLDGAERRRSQREARRLGVAMLLIGVGLGLILLAAVPFRGPGVGTRTIVLWLARSIVVLNTLGRQEDALLARLHLAALPVGVTALILVSCLVGVWRLTTYDRRPGRRPRRRTFVALFALTVVALALALLTPLRAWQTGALRWGDTVIANPDAGTVLVIGGNANLPDGLSGGVSVIFGSVSVSGSVQGDVVAVLGGVNLNAGTVVQGDVIAVGGRVENVAHSQVQGDVIGSAPILAQPPRSTAARLRLAIAAWIGLLLLAITLSALFPWPMLLVAATARRFTWQSMLTASGAGIGLLLVIVPLALSVAGLPIAIALLLVTLLAWAFGLVAVGVALGRRMLRPFSLQRSTLLAAVCGLGVLGAVAAVPIGGPLLII